MSTRPSAPMVQSSHHARRETGGLPVCSPGSCPALAFRCRAIASNSASTDKRTPPNALLGLIKNPSFPRLSVQLVWEMGSERPIEAPRPPKGALSNPAMRD